jgi:uncharacterized protein YbjT (DUF2867 family)
MKIILFGATGMVGRGVLRECLLDPRVDSLLVVGRSLTGQRHPKLKEIEHRDFTDFSPIAAELTGYDACFFCLGISVAGLSEEQYRHVTYAYTLAAAELLAKRNPGMTFIYVSGAGTDSTGKGRSMWARVKGQTENALLKLPFKGAYMFRPGIIEPLYGARSKTPAYRTFYMLTKPVLPVLRLFFPNHILTTEQVARAMLKVARLGAAKQILEAKDISVAVRD